MANLTQLIIGLEGRARTKQTVADLGKTGSAFLRCGRSWPLMVPCPGKSCTNLHKADRRRSAANRASARSRSSGDHRSVSPMITVARSSGRAARSPAGVATERRYPPFVSETGSGSSKWFVWKEMTRFGGFDTAIHRLRRPSKNEADRGRPR